MQERKSKPSLLCGLVVNYFYRVIVMERLSADLTLWLSVGVIFAPLREHLVILGDLFGCFILGGDI